MEKEVKINKDWDGSSEETCVPFEKNNQILLIKRKKKNRNDNLKTIDKITSGKEDKLIKFL